MELHRICTDEKGIISAFAESRIGGRSENQDSYGWENTNLGYLITVCDGMGGGPGGKTASTIAVKEIIAGITEAQPDEDISNIVIKAIRRANMAIIETASEKPELKGMGSTATVLLLSERSAIVAHVGDSRIYQLRGNKKIFRTFDHSVVFEMVKQGVITEEQARLSAQSNVITRALGVKPDVEVELRELPYEKGDRFILCTDGIHGMLSEKELIKRATKRNDKPGIITDDIATYIDGIGRASGGGHDNLTLVLVETNINSKLKTKMSKHVKLIMTGLLALFVISISLNIVQCSSSISTENIGAMKDSLEMLSRKLKTSRDSINGLNKRLTETDSIKNEYKAKLNEIEKIATPKGK